MYALKIYVGRCQVYGLSDFCGGLLRAVLSFLRGLIAAGIFNVGGGERRNLTKEAADLRRVYS